MSATVRALRLEVARLQELVAAHHARHVLADLQAGDACRVCSPPPRERYGDPLKREVHLSDVLSQALLEARLARNLLREVVLQDRLDSIVHPELRRRIDELLADPL